MASIILNQVLPYQDINFFKDYFRTLYQIVYERDRKARRTILTLYAVIAAELLHFLYFYTSGGELPLPVQFMHYDIFHIVKLTETLYLLVVPIFLMTAYYLHLMYFSYNDINFLLFRVIILRQDGWFLQPRRVQGQPACRYFIRFTLNLVNGFQVFILFIDIFILASETHSIHFWATHEPKFLFNLFAWYKLFLNELSLLLLYCTVFIFVHTCLLMATLGIVFLRLFSVKLEQIRRILMVSLLLKPQTPSPTPPPSQFSAAKKLTQPNVLKTKLSTPPPPPPPQLVVPFINYPAFLRESVHCLRTIVQANDIYGKALFVFLLINCPLNCALVSLLLIGEQIYLVRLFIVVFVAQQFIAILVIHLLVARLNGKIHLPVGRLMHLATNDPRITQPEACGSKSVFRFRWRIAAYIEAYHVEYFRQYGLRYWRFSIITIVTFCKYLGLYFQVLLYSYKMFTQRSFV